MTTAILAAGETNWNRLAGPFQEAIVDTLVMVGTTLVIGGLCGLILGMLLYTTRAGGVLQNKFIFGLLNILVNFVRPIPFIILLVTLGPLTKALVGSQIGRDAAIVGMSVAATFGVARIVEQNLVTIDPGMIEAARAMGASPLANHHRRDHPRGIGSIGVGLYLLFHCHRGHVCHGRLYRWRRAW